jgi:hypothetical protein
VRAEGVRLVPFTAPAEPASAGGRVTLNAPLESIALDATAIDAALLTLLGDGDGDESILVPGTTPRASATTGPDGPDDTDLFADLAPNFLTLDKQPSKVGTAKTPRTPRRTVV